MHKTELETLASKMAEILELSKDDYFIDYWEADAALIFSTFEYTIIIRPNGDNFILETSFYIVAHPNLVAYTILALNSIDNIEIEIYETFDYDKDGGLVFESDMDLKS